MTGIDRKAIPDDLEQSYRRNVGFYQDFQGRPIRSKPLLHRDPSVEAIPSRFETSTTGPMAAGPGTGLLELVLDSAATMPVSSVDEEPVAVGDGTVHVILPVGRHVVEVQGGDTCSPVVVDIADGGTTTLFWREEADRATRRFGPRVTESVPPKSLVYLYDWLFVVFLLCGLPVAVVNSFSLGDAGSVAAVVTVAAIVLILLALYPWKRKERARIARERTERASTELSRVVHHPWDGPDDYHRPALLGEHPERLPEFTPGGAGLLLRMRAHRHLWKEGDGVRERDAELAGLRVASPRVRVDDMEQPATWGNWWYPIRPGRHTVEVSFDAAPAGPDAEPQWIGESVEIEARADEVSALTVNAHVFADRDDGAANRIRVGEGALFTDSDQFHTEWMDDPVKRLDFWS